MDKSSFMQVRIDDDPEIYTTEENDFKYSPLILEQERQGQKRQNWKHIVTHSLAYILVIPFIFMLIYGFIFSGCKELTIPTYYIAIVSTVIGFYFGEKYYNNKN